MGDLCTKAGERETRQKSVSLPPKAGKLTSLKSTPLHTDVQSHLSGSSGIQPLVVSKESWHLFFILSYFIYSCFLNKKCLLSFFLLLTGTGFQTGHIAPLCPRYPNPHSYSIISFSQTQQRDLQKSVIFNSITCLHSRLSVF